MACGKTTLSRAARRSRRPATQRLPSWSKRWLTQGLGATEGLSQRKCAPRLRLQDALENSIPRRAVLLGAHGGGFLVADDYFLLGIPLNGAPAEAKRHVAEGADDRRSMTHFQVAERLVAALDAIDPIAFVGVEHLVFHRFTSRPTARAGAGGACSAAAAAARPPSRASLRLDPWHGLRVVIHRAANRMPHESWNLVDRVAVHLGNNLVGP